MDKLIALIVPRLAWLYISFVGITSKIIWLGKENEEALQKEGRNFIYVFWHGRQVFLTYAFRGNPAKVLVSQSKDGELIANVMHMFAMGTVRGSSSRGGAKALIYLKNELEAGFSVAITPDGPRGPQRAIAPGVLFLAQKISKPILPVTYSAKRKIIFHGWDEYWVPLPFNVIAVKLGKPFIVGPSDGAAAKSVELKNEIDRITEEADSFITNR